MLKILHVTPSFYPALVYGGPTLSVYGLCRGLVRQGCEVRVLTTDANGPNSVLDVNTSEQVEVSPGLLVRYCHRVADVSVSPALLAHLVSHIRWAQVVHLMAVYSFPTIPTLLACKILGKPVVWSPRGMLQRWEGTSRRELKMVWEQVCRLAAPRHLVLHTTSEEEALHSGQRLPGVETVVVPNGVEIPDRIPHRKDQASEFRLVYLGRLHPIKGLENLLNAYKLFTNSITTRSSLVIAGAGDEAYTKAIRLQIRALGLTEKVEMVGFVDGDARERIFQNADVVVVPSHIENFGLVVAEALAHSVPVIASRGTPWQRLEERGCGLWVDTDSETLAAAIRRISSMPLREMGSRGRAWMEMEFGWNIAAEKMVRVYRNLLPTRASHRGLQVNTDRNFPRE